MIDPHTLPVAIKPTYVAELMPMGPGVIWLMAMMSVNSCGVSQP
ncbi:hypothetical protein EVA_15026 [gut metagenome]|uniref:Uncharacterized protein n=1 Tax=gut metagenome TaxID=749906 RepID=J9FPK1_9ZZZZ